MNNLRTTQETYKPSHAYTSSDESSYNGRIRSLSRSESGTSETHYDDLTHDPPPKTLMDDYARDSFDDDRTQAPARKSRTFDGADPMAMHLLLETAVGDSQLFDVLSPEQLDRLKKEEASLVRTIEGLKRKLYLETKVRNAAQSVNRLQSKTNGAGDNPSDMSTDLAESSRKCEEIAQELWRLEKQQYQMQEQILKHTAAVLQMNHQKQSSAAESKQNGWRDSDEWGTGFGFIADTADGIMELPSSGPSPAVQDKIHNVSETLHRIMQSTGSEEHPPPPQGTSLDEELVYLEQGLLAVQEWQHETTRLWDVLGSGEEEIRQVRLESSRSGEHDFYDDLSDDEFPHNEPFSLQALSSKVHRLCNRATNLSEQQVTLQSQLSEERELRQQTQEQHLSGQRALEDTQSQLVHARANLDQAQQELTLVQQHQDTERGSVEAEQELRSQLSAKEADVNQFEQLLKQLESEKSQLQAQINEHQQSLLQTASEKELLDAEITRLRPLENEKEDLEAEVVRLTTEVTVARAELDGAYGSRAERAAEAAPSSEMKKDLEGLQARNNELTQELTELVADHEALVRQGVDTERERETLESTIDTLRDRLESLEVQVNEERVRTMGLGNGREGTSMGVMRTEFKKMMREARTEHFTRLRAEQEERRRLEAMIRSLRREQAGGQASPSTLSPAHLGKSGLSRSVTAS